MKQTYDSARKNMTKMALYNKEYYDKTHQGMKQVKLKPGDKVLIRNVRDKGGSRKLKSYWEEQIFVVDKKKEDLPVYTVHNLKKASDIRTVHRNLLLNCDDLPLDIFEDKETIRLKKEKYPLKMDKADDNESDEESDEVIAVYHGMQDFENQVEVSSGDEVDRVSGSVATTPDEEADSSGSEEVQNEVENVCRYPKRLRRPPAVMSYDENFDQTKVHR